MGKTKYLITLWIDWYNYSDCILQKFSIEHESNDLNEASRKLDTIAREIIREGLKEFEDFAVMKAFSKRKSSVLDVNKKNKVIKRECRKIGDGGGHNFIYYDFDLIELPAEAKVDENLFNLKKCGREVSSFFKSRYQQSQKSTSAQKRFIGLRELAKGKLGFSTFSWLRK